MADAIRDGSRKPVRIGSPRDYPLALATVETKAHGGGETGPLNAPARELRRRRRSEMCERLTILAELADPTNESGDVLTGDTESPTPWGEGRDAHERPEDLRSPNTEEKRRFDAITALALSLKLGLGVTIEPGYETIMVQVWTNTGARHKPILTMTVDKPESIYGFENRIATLLQDALVNLTGRIESGETFP